MESWEGVNCVAEGPQVKTEKISSYTLCIVNVESCELFTYF